MAKIYQTKEDLQRDVVDKQVQRVKNHGILEFCSASFNGFISLFASDWNKSLKLAGKEKSWILTGVTIGTALMAGFDAVKSFLSYRKVHDLALQQEQLGPERIVLPPEPQAVHEQAHEQLKSFLDHVQKAPPIEATSLMEQAERLATEHSI